MRDNRALGCGERVRSAPKEITIETRLIIAYALTAMLVAAGVAIAFYLRHNSREVTLERDRKREQAAREERLMRRDEP